MDSSRAARSDGSSRSRACWQHLGRDPQVLRPHAVEPLAEVAQRVRSAMPDVLDDRADLLQGRLDVELGARQRGPQGAHLERASPQVEGGHHGVKSRFRADARFEPSVRAQAARASSTARSSGLSLIPGSSDTSGGAAPE